MAVEGSKTVNPVASNQTYQPTGNSLLGDDRTPTSRYKRLVEQIRAEWEYSYRTQNTKIQKSLDRLRLYNNQKRDDNVVGDNTLFTVMNSVLAALWSDEMLAHFTGRNEGQQDRAENLNNTAKYDSDEMGKPQLDFFWDWDTAFFGKGYTDQEEFDREKMCPSPTLIDPTCWLQDPDAVTLNPDPTHKYGARWCGTEELMTKWQMKEIPEVFDLDYVKLVKVTRSLIDQARQSRQDAQGLNQQIRTEEKDLGENAYYQITKWRTFFKDDVLTGGEVKRVLVWLANDRTKVIRFKILKNQKKWMVNERSLFPSSHDFFGTSICDLVEDKQRMKAVLLNLQINRLKAKLFKRFIYDRNTVKSKGDLNYDFNKHIGVDMKQGQNINNVLRPVEEGQDDFNLFDGIMKILDDSSQRAAAVPDMQQGQIQRQDRTLGELGMVNTKVANRYSLATAIFGWSEKEFWENWYWLYKTYMESAIDEKIIQIGSIFEPKYFTIKKSHLIGDTDPKVRITSKFMTDTERYTNKMNWNELSQVALQYPNTNRRFLLKKMARLHGATNEDIEQLYPPTPDEQQAREENILLAQDKQVPVKANENHAEHLTEHNKCPQTNARLVHVATHMRAIEFQKARPDLFPQQQQQQQQDQQQNQNAANQLATMKKKKGNQPNPMGGMSQQPNM